MGPVVSELRGTVVSVTPLVTAAVVCGTVVTGVAGCVVPGTAVVSCSAVPEVIDCIVPVVWGSVVVDVMGIVV